MENQEENQPTATVLRSPDSEKASEAGRALGRIRSPRKAESGRRTLSVHRNKDGAPMKDPLALPCTCGAGTETEVGVNHKTTCPRGRLLYQRGVRAARAAKKEEAGNGSD